MNDWEREARQLQQDWESPDLWPRIAQALEGEKQRPRGLRVWLMPVAAALVVAFAATLWIVWRPQAPAIATPQLLTDQALAELKTKEAAYLESIDNLARLAQPAIEMPPTPLIEAYRERLALLDDAIAELRSQAEDNPLHAHLRSQLAALYREKQETLQEVVTHAE